MQPGIPVKAVAYKGGMADREPAEAVGAFGSDAQAAARAGGR